MRFESTSLRHAVSTAETFCCIIREIREKNFGPKTVKERLVFGLEQSVGGKKSAEECVWTM